MSQENVEIVKAAIDAVNREDWGTPRSKTRLIKSGKTPSMPWGCRSSPGPPRNRSPHRRLKCIRIRARSVIELPGA